MSWEFLAGGRPPIVDIWLCSGRVTEADVWLCYDPGNKTDMWQSCIQRSRCCHHTAVTICIDEIRDSAMLDVRWLLSLKAKPKINKCASWSSQQPTCLPPQKNQYNIPKGTGSDD